MTCASHLSIKEQILIESFLGDKDDDNITLLLKQYNGLLPILYVQKIGNNTDVPAGKRILKNSIKYIIEVQRSKYIITNSRMHDIISLKRDGQKLIQIWHGTPWKKLAFDQENFYFGNQSRDEYLCKFAEDVKRWDYLWAPDEYTKEKFTSAFRYRGRFIEGMYPSTIKLLELGSNEEYKRRIKGNLGISTKEKVILYMPTFRENTMTKNGNYQNVATFDIEKFLKVNRNTFILERSHYLVKNNSQDQENWLNVTSYSSVTDLYLIADVLITDYSSAIYSYSFLRKPIISIQGDLHKYQEMRGLYNDAIRGMNINIVCDVDSLYAEALNTEKLKKSQPKMTQYNINQKISIEDIFGMDSR